MDHSSYVVTFASAAYTVNPCWFHACFEVDVTGHCVDVTVTATLPSDAVWISSEVEIDYAESSTPEVSDNDASGHCGKVDDGLDAVSDSGTDTDDDDPTRLPLMQATQYEACSLAFEDLKNAGWNDWDMNDLVLDVTSFYVVNGSGGIESVIVTYEVLAAAQVKILSCT